jgi:hypothetical protein
MLDYRDRRVDAETAGNQGNDAALTGASAIEGWSADVGTPSNGEPPITYRVVSFVSCRFRVNPLVEMGHLATRCVT